MKIHSKKLPQHEIDNLINILKNHEKETLNPNIDRFFVYEGVAISIYKTNTVLFQGKNVDYVVDILLQKNGHQLTEQIIDVSEITEKSFNTLNLTEIGCDEVGVGDYFGGMVTAAAVVIPEQITNLKNEIICDSKLINDKKIIEIYERINSRIKFSFTSITALEYNELFEKFKNAHIIKTYLHNKTLAQLFQKEKFIPENVNVILDQYANSKNYYEYLEVINPDKKIDINVFEIKAESKYFSVALASIIARYHFLQQIEQLQAEIDLPIFLGASNPQIKIIVKKIHEKYGFNKLKNFVKLHFKTTEKIIKNAKNEKKIK